MAGNRLVRELVRCGGETYTFLRALSVLLADPPRLAEEPESASLQGTKHDLESRETLFGEVALFA